MAVSVLITIDGVDRTEQISNVRYTSAINAVGRATFSVVDPTGTYVPAEDDPVEITLGGVLAWAGEVAEVDVDFLGVNKGVRVRVTAHDKNELVGRQPVNAIYPSQTLRATLEELTDPGGVLNGIVTLDPAQATGPTLDVITAAWTQCDDLLAHLTKLTSYVWRVNASGQLAMWDVGSRSSGVTLSLANANIESANWSRRRFNYRNAQWVVYGPAQVQAVTDEHVGDGSTRVFNLRYSVATIPASVVANGITKPVGIYGADPLEWTYDAATGTNGAMRQDGAYPALGAGQALLIPHNSNFPNSLYYADTAEIALRGATITKVHHAADVTSYAEALALAQALIRENKPRPQKPVIRTTASGIDPGETVVISLAPLSLSATCFVEQIETSLIKEGALVRPTHALTLAAGDEKQEGMLEFWRKLVRGASSGSSSGGLLSGGGGGGGTTTISNGLLRLFFGGLKQVNAPTWRSVAGNGVAFDAPDGLEWSITKDQVAGAILLRVHLKTDGGAQGAVSARLYNESDATAASDWTSGVTSSTFTYVSVFCTLADGEKVYKLQLRVSGTNHATANISYYNATLENRP